ncbi:protein of unknown function [Pseudobutyrivibrio sp. YE44]|uniref:DUF4316 domain-containing protein n=1 Tax=Pseudobutyrivibrio sp. YE44 TaxID=1520802 RepID=UPI00087F6011|nr:DUF4316 domain-containing protein [Pseudobutyrivibrio sp. YE44]SDB06915.1 protein of unknown function [Pseudobutyrivibrio sp. YE44]
MDGLDIANDRLSKEEELSDIEENIMEQHTIFSKKNHLKNAEDAIEGNDNNFDGIINNLPDDSPAEQSYKKSKEFQEKMQRAWEADRIAKTHKPHHSEIVR